MRAALSLLFLTVGAYACSDSTGPEREREPSNRTVEIGSTTTARLQNLAEIDTFRFVANGTEPLVVVLRSPQAAAAGTLLDDVAAGRMTLAEVFLNPAIGRNAFAYRLDPVAGRTYTLIVGFLSTNLPTTIPSGGFEYSVEISRVNLAPEQAGSQLSIGNVHSTESLLPGYDIDDFILSVGSATEVNFFLNGGRPGSGVHAAIYPVASNTAAREIDADGSREARTGVWELSGGDYRVRILSGRFHIFPDSAIPYRLEFYKINRAPEHVAANISRDVAVTDDIERPGDIDEFRFVAQAGEMFDVFLDASHQDPRNEIRLQVVTPNNTGIASTNSWTPGPGLSSRTGFFTAPVSGDYVIRVTGITEQATDSLDYTVLLHPVNPAPEQAAAVFQLGTTINEMIDAPSDIDQFALSVTEPKLAWFVVSTPTILGGGLSYDLEGTGIASTRSAQSREERHGPWLIGPGTHRLSLRGIDRDGGRFTGAYSIRSSAASAEPEIAPVVIRSGETVVESVNLIGDRDNFRLEAGPREYVEVRLEALGLAGGDFIVANISETGAPPLKIFGVPSDGAATSGRVALAKAGPYEIGLDAGRMAPDWETPGSYRLTVLSWPTAPETAAASLAVGDSVKTEIIDHVGDVDRFNISGTPNQRIVIGLTTANQRLEAQVFSPDSGTAKGAVTSFGAMQVTAPLQLNAEGRLSLDALDPCVTVPSCTTTVGSAYALYAWHYNTQPEQAAVSVTLADTIREAIDHPGDVDEFTLAGNAAQTVEFWIGRPATALGSATLSLDIIAPNGTNLSDPNVGVGTPPGGPLAFVGRHTLPMTGNYTVRVRWMSSMPAGTTPYLLNVR